MKANKINPLLSLWNLVASERNRMRLGSRPTGSNDPITNPITKKTDEIGEAVLSPGQI